MDLRGRGVGRVRLGRGLSNVRKKCAIDLFVDR
jgi:hypothetical protein